jgi:hypothetical protein
VYKDKKRTFWSSYISDYGCLNWICLTWMLDKFAKKVGSQSTFLIKRDFNEPARVKRRQDDFLTTLQISVLNQKMFVKSRMRPIDRFYLVLFLLVSTGVYNVLYFRVRTHERKIAKKDRLFFCIRSRSTGKKLVDARRSE